jgi:hypothetical protein
MTNGSQPDGSAGAPALLDRAFLDQHAGPALARVSRLVAYRSHLAVLRSFKAAGELGVPISGAADALASAGANDALADANAFVSHAIAVARRLRTGGALRGLAQAAAGQAANAPVLATDLVTQLEAQAAYLQTIGIDSQMVALFRTVATETGATATSSSSGLTVTGKVHGIDLRQSVATTAPPAWSPDLATLLSQGYFDRIAAALDQGEPAYALGGRPPGPMQMEDAVVTTLAMIQQEMVRHARGVQDRGLLLYAGGDPGTITVILVIAATVSLIGSAIAGYYCNANGQDSNHAACVTAAVLSILATLLMFLAVGAALQNPAANFSPIEAWLLGALAGS